MGFLKTLFKVVILGETPTKVPDWVAGAIRGAMPGNIPRLVRETKSLLNHKQEVIEFGKLAHDLGVAQKELDAKKEKVLKSGCINHCQACFTQFEEGQEIFIVNGKKDWRDKATLKKKVCKGCSDAFHRFESITTR